jgi:hypothetical protein
METNESNRTTKVKELRKETTQGMDKRDEQRGITRELDRAIDDVRADKNVEQMELQEQEDKWRKLLSMNGKEMVQT